MDWNSNILNVQREQKKKKMSIQTGWNFFAANVTFLINVVSISSSLYLSVFIPASTCILKMI